MEINVLIKIIRKDLGLSQKKFAEKLHVSLSTVNRWEIGHVTPNQLAIAILTDLCEKKHVKPMLL
ncbi:helix-turn-helix domain-containing protein [Scatolibacter rhodanostii]|uniref:helix-turn-helix domain-containing protein n=1 Tax=Scatolibacter rhodanostii TaxID=2014781 RepID=UPI000C07FFB6|nr:helix-turn-helix domain-containing protein [Scatolibacter rhodanostii]